MISTVKNRISCLLWILLTIFFISPLMAWQKSDKSWPWSKIDTDSITLPPDFLMGTAICEFQNSGELCKNSSWNRWQYLKDPEGKPRIKNDQKSGTACDHWNNIERDIKLMEEMGLTTFRFSVDWSVIEPEEGKFDPSAIDHYRRLSLALKEAKIVPMVTLHHFNNPLWFENIGGFEKPENTHYFVRFSQYVFEHLGALVPLWCTINEPGIYAFQGYHLFRGVFPPGKKTVLLPFEVLKNLMRAHVETYQALKAMPYGDQVQIGLAHQHLRFEPYHKWNPVEQAICGFVNPLLTDVLFKFFKTGVFEYTVPKLITIRYEVPRQQPFLDFLGINYYTRVLLKSQPSLGEPIVPGKRPGEIMTDMPYAMYPEGLYHAIAQLSEIGVPMYITETGIADARDDRRELFYRRYLYALQEAIKDGYNVKGLYIWTLMDNFEWDEGWLPRFGICSFDHETKEIKIRESTRRYFMPITKKLVEERQMLLAAGSQK